MQVGGMGLGRFCFVFVSELFTGHGPTGGSGQRVFEISHVRSGRIRYFVVVVVVVVTFHCQDLTHGQYFFIRFSYGT